MIEKEFICVVCPNGCSIKAQYEEGNPPKLISAEGMRCPRGKTWIQQEIENPMRTFSTSVLVDGGDFLEASVRLTKPVPLAKVFDVMDKRAQISYIFNTNVSAELTRACLISSSVISFLYSFIASKRILIIDSKSISRGAKIL